MIKSKQVVKLIQYNIIQIIMQLSKVQNILYFQNQKETTMMPVFLQGLENISNIILIYKAVYVANYKK